MAEIADEYKAIPISALWGWGLEQLSDQVEKILTANTEVVSLEVPYVMWDLVSEIRERGTVLKETYSNTGAKITCRLSRSDMARLSKKLPG